MRKAVDMTMAQSDILQSRATFSEDRVYRYTLRRTWDHGKGFCAFVGLNPSTADETNDDPTIRRCVGFARSWGYGGIMMLNLFAYRATDPRELLRLGGSLIDRAVGPDNNGFLTVMTELVACREIVCCWGAWPHINGRDKEVLALLSMRPKCLGLTQKGFPRHPLYVRADTPLQEMPR